MNSSLAYVKSCLKCDEMLFATYSLLGADKLIKCATCSSLDVCLTCQSGFLLKVDLKGCISACKTETSTNA